MSASSAKQAALIVELLAGKTLEQAAVAARVSYATARRWHADPTFAADLADARRQLVQRAIDALSARAVEAAEHVAQLVGDVTAPRPLRLRAALALLDRLHAWQVVEELAARVAALEEAQHARQ